MSKNNFIHPDSCQPGGLYYLRIGGNGTPECYREVTFIAYRPHPGEVTINDGDGARVIRRLDLYQKITSNNPS